MTPRGDPPGDPPATPPLDPDRFRTLLLEAAHAEGFELAGVARLTPSEHGEALDRWIEAGHHGTMHWIADPTTLALRKDPHRLLRGGGTEGRDEPGGTGWAGGAGRPSGTRGWKGTPPVGAPGRREASAADGSARAGPEPGSGPGSERGRERGPEPPSPPGSALVVGHGHFLPDPPGSPGDPSRGVIARYARGRDYHKVIKSRLRAVVRRVEAAVPSHSLPPWRIAVDSAPVLERELARRAGLGWFGRNTMLIHPRRGSHFFLGVLLLDAPVTPDAPFDRDHCGSCRACLDACPTGALLGRDAQGAPIMDARRCISYLTIEHRGAIPVELRESMGNRVYGCDICQEVCPFPLKFAEPTREPGYAARGPGERPVGVEVEVGVAGRAGSVPTPDPTPDPASDAGPGDVSAETSGSRSAPEPRPGGGSPRAVPTLPGGPLHPGTDAPPLVALLEMALDPEAWESFSRGSAFRRAGRAGFARNICVAMGNWLASLSPCEPPAEALAVLSSALSDPEPLVRGHAAWALGRVEGAAAEELLASAAAPESHPWVLEELEAGLSEVWKRGAGESGAGAK